MEIKAGWKTTEFWLAVVGKLISGLALIGIVNAGDATLLGDSLAKIIGALGVVVINAFGVWTYLRGRLALKSGGKLPLILLCALALCALAGPAQAQGIFPWRSSIHQRLMLLEQKGQQAPQQPIIIQPAPQVAAPAPQIIMIPGPIAQGPAPGPAPGIQQQLPIQGQPQQQLPIQGQPQQNLPIQGPIQQQLPIPGPIQQPLPIQGQPQQQLPIQGQPQQTPPPPPTAPPFTPSPTPAPPSGGWPPPQQSLPITNPQRLSAWHNCLYRMEN